MFIGKPWWPAHSSMNAPARGRLSNVHTDPVGLARIVLIETMTRLLSTTTSHRITTQNIELSLDSCSIGM
jgi:hypothetical protein